MSEFVCKESGKPYPQEGMPYRCLESGGYYDLTRPPFFHPNSIERDLPGMWRYRHAFALFDGAPVVSLGEGDTPLVWDEYNGAEIGLKLESLNPTGSYKDRGTAVLVSQLLARGVSEAVEDSSGNAGASFAAYAARAGIKARVFVPEYASGPKQAQIEAYGAELIGVPGERASATQAALKEVENGAVYASHAYLPFGLPGIATIAYELWEALGDNPVTIVAPVGHGGLLRGVMSGFAALHQQHLIPYQPYYVGVQARACAPLWAGFWQGPEVMDMVEQGESLAEGILIREPSQGKKLLENVRDEKGEFVAVEEVEIAEAHVALAHRGVYVEPTSAVVWAALEQIVGKVPEPIIVIMTGAGLKQSLG
ncbi:MAG: pyridoxal-phosphate dependent enzyme [Anaerolineales bacterium]|nr:pyridoxal-phosphate dependent enzyme [Anaerolineales bacterium]